jgi:4a-hydroxytetrahydrobiopterin dehydratase
LDGANFLFHVVLRFPIAPRRTTRIFAAKETPTIIEFLRAFNEEPMRQLQAFATETALLLARRLRRIMFLPRLSDPRGDAIMPAKKLTDSEVQKLLSKAKGWSVVNGKLHREFACKDFITAFGNMTRVALVAEAMNHHPEWFNVWNKVVIDLSTHSVSGISDYDLVLAEKINEIFGA